MIDMECYDKHCSYHSFSDGIKKRIALFTGDTRLMLHNRLCLYFSPVKKYDGRLQKNCLVRGNQFVYAIPILLESF